MVEERQSNDDLAEMFLFETNLPLLASAMNCFDVITQIAEFGGRSLSKRALSCWPEALPKKGNDLIEDGPEADPARDSNEQASVPTTTPCLSKENYILFKDKVRDVFKPLFIE